MRRQGFSRKRAFALSVMSAILIALCLSASASAQVDTLWLQDWESGWGSWWVDGGQWEVGVATFGPPDTAYSGVNCAATNLDGNYTEPSTGGSSQVARLISPMFVVPSDNPRLRFYHWYDFNLSDYGRVQLRVNGGAWVNVSGTYVYESHGWTRPFIDLSDYADSVVEIAFLLRAHNNDSYDPGGRDTPEVEDGWYLDDVVVESGPVALTNPEDFEFGLGHWWSESGMWQVGAPTSGPGIAYSGDSCAATVLAGDYTEPPWGNYGQSSRLISPPFVVPSDNPRLRFWHWYDFNLSDYGKVQVRVNGATWVDVSTAYVYESHGWTRPFIDLSDYADSVIEIGFLLTTLNNDSYDPGGRNTLEVEDGWYLDDVVVESGPVALTNPEDFEFGLGHWWSESGMWQVGAPTSGPGTAYSGDSCAATVLAGNYTEPPWGTYGQSSRLISPPFVVPANSPQLRFWHWYDFSHSDYGLLQIRVNGGAWIDLSSQFVFQSGPWSPYQVSLSPYVDSVVEIGFLISTTNDDSYDPGGRNRLDVATGWYIDLVSLQTACPLVWAPTSTMNLTVCDLGNVKLPLQITNYSSVSTDAGTWDDDTLYFSAPSDGLYEFEIVAENSICDDTALVKVNVIRNVPMAMDLTEVAFVTSDTDTVVTDTQYVHISSTCGPGLLNWNVSVLADDNWIEMDKTSGTNPDSLVLTLDRPGSSFSPGIYNALLRFSDDADSTIGTLPLTLFVESGVSVGTEYALPGTRVSVPIYLHTNDSLKGFTIPLQYFPDLPTDLVIDSVVYDQGIVDTVIIWPDDQTIIVDRDVQEPPMPDSTYKLGSAWFTVSETAPDQEVLIDTTTVIDGLDTISYQFVLANDDTTVPAFRAGKIIIGDPASEVFPCCDLRGDVNTDDGTNISDLTYLVDYLFRNGPAPECIDQADCNGDGSGDVSDVTYLIDFLFRGGPAPVPCQAKRAAKSAGEIPEVVVSSVFDCGNTIIELSTTASLNGLALTLDGVDPVEIENLVGNGIEVIHGTVDGQVRIGVLDMQGLSDIPAGESRLISVPGQLELISALASDQAHRSVAARIELGVANNLLPRTYELSQNYPNPFNPTTTIEFALPSASPVRLEVINVLGQTVTTLVDSDMEAGYHSVEWDGTDGSGSSVASGVYFYRINAGDFTRSHKMLLLK